jgi:hypothetical protein
MATSETAPQLGKIGVAPKIRKLALRYPELSKSDIARKVGCTRQNVSCVLNTFLDNRSPATLLDFQTTKAEVYDALQLRILESLTAAEITKAPLMARVTSAAILEDKARLVRGQATGISMIQMLDVVEAIKAQRANPRTISVSIDDISPISADKRNDAANNK